jgi:cysteine desulfurase
MSRIYLDHSATTPLRPEVLEAMAPYLRDRFGNAGSIHSFGRECRRAVDDSRDQVAALIGADPREIIFTSGGTEADNMVVHGVVAAHDRPSTRVITSSIEHHAVLHAVEYVARHHGVDARVVGVNDQCLVRPGDVAEWLDDDTVLVSIMHANNETGAIQPVDEIAAVCAERGVPFHSDAVQSAGKIPIDVRRWPVASLAVSAHKLYGPKGVGACFLRKGTRFEPQAVGGFQERERRAGTENVAGIVGFGKACELARVEMESEAARLAALRDQLESGLFQRISGVHLNGPRGRRLPHLLNVRFDGVEGESIVLGLDVEGIAVSSGAACTSGSLDPSHVLLAMGLSYEQAQGAVRFSLGRSNTTAEIDRALEVLVTLVQRLRGTCATAPMKT